MLLPLVFENLDSQQGSVYQKVLFVSSSAKRMLPAIDSASPLKLFAQDVEIIAVLRLNEVQLCAAFADADDVADEERKARLAVEAKNDAFVAVLEF